MNRRSSNRFLLWALALSLAVHSAVAVVVHRIPPAQAEPETPTRVVIIRVAMTPPPTPPRPVVHPQNAAAQHSHTHSQRIAVRAPHANSRGTGPTEPIAPATAGPAQPGDVVASTGPSATPAPACSQPYVAAHTIDPVIPSAPDEAAGLQGTAEVQVSLDAAGRVTDARIYHSTGSMILDRTAIDAARRSTYAPQIVDCQPAGGTYLFRVDFQD